MIRLLIIGAGLIGARHAAHAARHPACTLVGVVDADPGRAEAHGVPGFETIDQVDLPVDAAIVATPTATHADIGAVAAARGWAVLVEKPIAHTLEAADTLIDACRMAGVPLLIGHHRRHHAAVRSLRQTMGSGLLGRIVGLSAIWSVRKPDPYFEVPWREGADGSPVLINLVHDIDLLRFVFGEILEIDGHLSTDIRGRQVEDSGALALRFASGAIGTILFSDAAPSPWGFEAGTGENPNIAPSGEDSMRVLGTKAAMAFPSLTVFDGAADWSEPQSRHPGEMPVNIPLDAQISHLDEIVSRGADPLCSGKDGRRALELALSIRGLAR